MNSNPCHYDDQPTFLWYVLYLYFVKHSIDQVMQLVSSMYEQKFDFSADFEGLLLGLWETSDITRIFEIAKISVKQRLFNIEKHIFIIAVLVDQGKLSIAEATQFLNIEQPHDYASLDSRVKRVIDVAWLVTEDTKDGIMSPSDDNVLREALKDVTTLFSVG